MRNTQMTGSTTLCHTMNSVLSGGAPTMRPAIVSAVMETT